MNEMTGELASEPNAIISRQNAIAWFASNYPKIKPATVSAHLTRLSTNARSRIHFNAKPGEDDVFYQIDKSHFRLYRPGDDPPPITSLQPLGPTRPPEEENSAGRFAYEPDLRNYLVKNLESLEQRLRLYEEEGIRGIEFPVGGRFIDILAKDATGGLVVIELKVSRGYDKVVGQLMRYVAWIQKNLAENGQRVRGIIVAREISEDLLLACSLVPDVELFEYELALSLKRADRQ